MKTFIIKLIIPIIILMLPLTSFSFSGRESFPEKEKTTSDLQLMSKFVGSEVKNEQGENLGRITEVSIDQDNWEINYAVLLFQGNKLFAIPITAFTLNQKNGNLMLNIKKSVLEQTNGFDDNNWPASANPRLLIPPEISDEGRHLWEKTFDDWERAIASVKESPKAIKGDEFLKYEIEDPKGRKLGTIKDLLMDPNENTIFYAVVSLRSEEFTGQNANLYVIPIRSLKFSSDRQFKFSDTKIEGVSKARYKYVKLPGTA